MSYSYDEFLAIPMTRFAHHPHGDEPFDKLRTGSPCY